MHQIQPIYGDQRRGWLAGLLGNLRYAVQGRRDGRRGMPTVSATGAKRTPALQHLADEMDADMEAVRAQALTRTAAQRVELAELTAEGGLLDRAEQKLRAMMERLEEIQCAPAATDRRFGEDLLPEELVMTRRQREHYRKVKQARKRVEDARTGISDLMSRKEALAASIREQLSLAEARTRFVGDVQRSRATSYLNGALRKHPDRPLLSATTPQLMPGAESSTASARFEDHR